MTGLPPKRNRCSEQLGCQIPEHQNSEQLSSRQIATIYNIRNCNEIIVQRLRFAAVDDAKDAAEDDLQVTDGQHAAKVLAEHAISAQTRALHQENELL